MRISHIILVTLLSVTFSWGQGEGIVLEQLAAKLGGEILLSSEIQSNLDYQEAVNGGLTQTQECQVVEDLFLQKLLIDQAKVDSVIVAPEQVEGQLQAKIDYILQTMNGDVERFQNYYGKTVTQVKNMMRKDLSDQMMANQMRSKILENVQITPREVINYFESIPQDSLPFFNAEVEVGELLMFPEVNQDERDKAIAQIVDIQNQIEDGVSFNELARKHSDDPGSARMGGDLGWQARGQFVPEFEAAAFNLENGEISDIVESEFGFHLIRLLERRGNRIHVEHILIKPEITEADVEKASAKLDSIRTLILRDSVPWEIAVRKFGSDKTQSFHNGGRMTNPKTGNTFFETPDVETDVFFAIDTLDVGGVTRPIEQYDQYSRSYSLRIIKLFSRSKPHTANLGEDYDKIKTAAVQQRQQMYLDQWLDGKITETFIEINPEYIPECETMEKWRRVNLFTSQP